MAVDVYVSESHPIYQVWVDGVVYATLVMRSGAPLTWSQQWDIADRYREALSW